MNLADSVGSGEVVGISSHFACLNGNETYLRCIELEGYELETLSNQVIFIVDENVLFLKP